MHFLPAPLAKKSGFRAAGPDLGPQAPELHHPAWRLTLDKSLNFPCLLPPCMPPSACPCQSSMVLWPTWLRRESGPLVSFPVFPGLGGEQAFFQTPQPLSCLSRLVSSSPLAFAQAGLLPLRLPCWLLLHTPQERNCPWSVSDTPVSHVTRLGRLSPFP